MSEQHKQAMYDWAKIANQKNQEVIELQKRLADAERTATVAVNLFSRIAMELKCLPSFVDAENTNEHIFKKIKELISTPEKAAGEEFPMLDGPKIPWSLAGKIYEVYAARFGRQQSLEMIAARGGFGWSEIPIFYQGRKSND